MAQEFTVIDHRIRNHMPKVSVLVDAQASPLTTAAIKRHRFVQNLKNNHQKLIEAMAYVERFAVICELSPERIAAIRKAKDEAMEELAKSLEEKLKAYEERIKGEPK